LSAFLDLKEALYWTRERNIEISIEKDHLFDSVSGLENQLYKCRKSLQKLQKQYDQLKKVHAKCSKSIFLYR
jgi:hypothetical protein